MKIQTAEFKQQMHLNHSAFVGIKYRYFYQQIELLQQEIGFDTLPVLVRNLATIRIFEPASKLRSIDLMAQYFDVHHSRKTYYKIAPECIQLQDLVEQKVLSFAKAHYSFNYDLLFYDVTTLYFEAFEEDALRKNGFSKDNKSQQPQILIALMVSKEGFPIAYKVFPGNTFEGHTFMPVIKDFVRKNEVKNFTIVADAAMISTENVNQLNANNINYIVGARLGNISVGLLKTIDEKICREDGKNIRIKTGNGDLICSFSAVRYRKDKYEMEKQIEKAKQVIEKPSKTKRLKFTQTEGTKVSLNEPLIEKSQKLLGIKGYYTNLKSTVVDNATIIEQYHQLYKIEQTFRISKSDLQTRPIFHFKEQPIKLHILVCFMALVVAKHIELRTGNSIRKFIDEAKKVVDGEILNQITNKVVTVKAKPTTTMEEIVAKLFAPH
ncbi:MAG: IS1634 family transposase [Bacteroidetes bacterium]|nr:IS1634 family transposase [Bacteroidota bacterium]